MSTASPSRGYSPNQQRLEMEDMTGMWEEEENKYVGRNMRGRQGAQGLDVGEMREIQRQRRRDGERDGGQMGWTGPPKTNSRGGGRAGDWTADTCSHP